MVFCFALPAMAEDASTIDVSGKLVILHTNDIHGRAVNGDGVLGYSRIAQVKTDLELLGASVLLLDAGDATQGTPLVNLSQGASAIDFMIAAGYDAMTLGNHEFDWGFDNLQQILEGAPFDVLCANITDSISGESVFTPNKVYEVASGIKVGIFGLDTPETMTKAHPDKVKGITFAMNEDLYAVAQGQVDELKAAGADIIVCLGHLGVDDESAPNRSIDVIDNTTGIDIFIDGHSHTNMNGGERFGTTLLTSTGEYGQNLGYIIIDGADVIKSGNYTGVDAEVEDLVNTIDAQVNEQLSASFATTEVLLDGERAPGVRTQETNLGDFSADAILWGAQQALGEEAVVAAVTNGGGIRTSIEVGDVTMLTMKTVFPFGNEVTTITVTGAELLEALEAATCALPEASGAFPQVAGIEFTIDTTVPYENGEQYPDSTYFAPAKPGSRVTIATVGGEAFDLEALYTIATNDFTAAGGDTYYAFRYAYQTAGYKTGVALEDALVNYTTTVLGGVIGEQYAAPQGRITIK
ncbi:MAG: bifunctional metallophosphatase/5'-nucleotidase [Clostridiales bacterium]|nr:bifunctional metallophosphatase/5'-nucleotidase [Clostridiales bacterium]